MSPSKKNIVRRNVQRTTTSNMASKPKSSLISKIFQHRQDVKPKTQTKSLPISNIHPAELAQSTTQLNTSAVDQGKVAQRRALNLKSLFSDTPGMQAQISEPMRSQKPGGNPISPLKAPTPHQWATISGLSNGTPQTPLPNKVFTNTQTHIAALPRQMAADIQGNTGNPNHDLGALRGLFIGQVRQRIANAKYYPRMARRRGMEGQPIIAFTLDRGGRLMKVNLSHTSGYQLLDQAALDAVHKAVPYPEIPPDLKIETYQFKLPISFILK